MYAKLFSSITESSLWSEPKEVRLLFVTMLAKADQTGFVEASTPGLARAANLTIEETKSSLEVLMNPDPYSKNPDNEGRRIIDVSGGFMLLNYEDYRARRNNEERQEYMRAYMKEYRKRSKQSVNNGKPQLAEVSHGYPQLAQAEAEAEADLETEEKAEATKDVSRAQKISEVLDAWNSSESTAKVRKLTKDRKAKLTQRLQDCDWPWQDAIAKLPIPNTDRFTWQPDFDWLITNDRNAYSLAEGKYDKPTEIQSQPKPRVMA